MANRPSLPACTPSGKMVAYGKGVAPTLNYQVPQKTSFTTYGDIGLNLPASFFKVNARAIPEEVLQYNRMSIAEIAAFLKSKKSFPTQNVPLALKKLSDIRLVSGLNTEFPPPSVSGESEGVTQGFTYTGYSLDPNQSAQDSYIDKLSVLLKDGKAVQVFDKFGNFDTDIIVTQRPEFPDARLFIIEEYKTASFLGDYGAGETVKTFSLLPGEKTTITVKTFREKTSTESRAENIMDSFSENSAKDFEKSLQDERQTQNQNTSTKGTSVGGSVGFKIGPFGASGNANKTTAASAVRTANTNSLSKSLEKHTDSTNASRQMSVNTTTNDSFKESVEESTVRELVNPNVSRVLNFVFRQLLQEYVSVTYLSDIKIAFTNGHPESFVVLPIEELDEMLERFVVKSRQAFVKDLIVKEYATIENANGQMIPFLETKTKKTFAGVETSFLTRKKDVRDSFQKPNMAGDAVSYPVSGVVLKADLNTLRTDSFIVDALLGQGEALDCFNSHVQEAKMQTLYIENAQKQLEHNRTQTEISKIGRENKLVAERMAVENQRLQLALTTLESLKNNPTAFAEAYGKMFNPQQNVINT